MFGRTTAYRRFMASLKVTFPMVHNGDGYALDALDAMTASERRKVETHLLGRSDRDWRDTEALLRLASPAAIDAVRDSIRTGGREVRLKAAEGLYLRGEIGFLEEAILEGLCNAEIGTGLVVAEWLAARYPTDAIKRLLLDAVFTRTDNVVGFGTTLFSIYEPEDWRYKADHAEFFYRLGQLKPVERKAPFCARCRELGLTDPLLGCSD